MKKTIAIEGMTCGHCVHAVREALSNLDRLEIEDVIIGMAVIEVEPTCSDEDIRNAVEEEGYTVSRIT